MKINRERLYQALCHGDPIKSIINRSVGKTTSAILIAIGASYNAPGKPIKIQDPDCTTVDRAKTLRKQTQLVLQNNKLHSISVLIDTKGTSEVNVYVVNNFIENLLPKD